MTTSTSAGRLGTSPSRACDLPWRTAYDLAWDLPSALSAEVVTLADAVGRVLAGPIRALAPCPAFDVAAMDGYAIAGTGPWQIIGRIRAGGSAWDTPLAAGQAIEIATGAAVPRSAVAVVPYENADSDGRTVTAAHQARTHIRRTGEDAARGDVLVNAGHIVTGTVVGAAAQAGADELPVHGRPRVRAVITGDEVITTGVPAPGQVRDALSAIVTALAERAGATMIGHQLIPDNPVLLADALRPSADTDVIVVTGSSSVGVHDHLHRILARGAATWHIDGVQCRPGHPQILARSIDGTWIVGIPGNPYAGLAAGLTILEPVLAALAGRRQSPAIRLPVSGAIPSHRDGTVLAPVRLFATHAEIIEGGRPGSLRAAASADSVAVIEPSWTPGAPVCLLPVP